MDEILRDAGLAPPTRLLTLAMAMNRLIAPASENAMPDWIRSTALGDLVGEDFSALSHQALYRNRDRLQEKRGAIESAHGTNPASAIRSIWTRRCVRMI